MRSFFSKTLLTLSVAFGTAGTVQAQYNGMHQPSLLPMPTTNYSYPAATPVAMRRTPQEAPSSAEAVLPPSAQDYLPSHSDSRMLGPSNGSYPSLHSEPVLGSNHCVNCPTGSGYAADYQGGGMMGGGFGHRHLDGGCGAGGCGADGGWYGNVGGLIMTRDRTPRRNFSFNTGDFSESLLNSRDAEPTWAGGFETRVGKYFNCNQNAIEAIYWGLFPGQRQARAYDPDGEPFTAYDLSTNLNFRTLDVDGVPVQHFYNQALEHRITRGWSAHNVEVNVLGGSCGWNTPCFGTSGGCAPALRFNWLAGVRYFRFRETFEFASVPNETITDEDDPYNINVTNNLIGFQLGGRATYCLSDRFSVYGGTKLGLYGNNISHHSRIGTADHVAVVNDPGQINDGREFDIRSRLTDVSFLGEIDLGMNYQLTSHWSLYGGYRAIAVTGLAMTLDQIPHDFANLQSVADIDSNSSMILHGAYAGVMFNF